MVAALKPLFVSIGETKLPFDAVCDLPGYKAFLKNLEVQENEHAHGGVGLYVQTHISAFRIELVTDLQAVAVSMKIKRRITVCSIYLPPGQNIHRRQLEALIDQLPRPFLLLGDFNARSKLWYDSDYCQRGKMIEKLIEEGDFFFLDKDQKTHFSRRHKTFSHVDLSLCSIDLIDSFKWEVDDDYHNSDHAPIYLTSNEARPKGGPEKWVMKKADWEKFTILSDLDDGVMNDMTDIDQGSEFLRDHIINAANDSIPKSKGTGGRKSPPWWNRACFIAIKKRKAAWRKYKKDSIDTNYIAFSRLRAEAQRVIRCSKRNSWIEFINSINSQTKSGTMWRKIKMLQGKCKSAFVSTLKVDKEKILVVEGGTLIHEIMYIVQSFGRIVEIHNTIEANGRKLLIRFEKKEAAKKARDQLGGGQYSTWNVKVSLLGEADEKVIYDDPVEIANCLGRRFAYVSSEHNCDPKFIKNKKQRERPLDFTTERNHGYNNRITMKELNAALDATGDSSPGLDGIHYSMLKNLAKSGKRCLLEFLNKVLDCGKLPTNWKIACVIPILKEGKDPMSPDSYRPIALTSCVCKLLERILNKRLMWFLVKNNLIDKAQTGFQKGKSAMDNLTALETEIHNAFVKKQYLLSVFFDLEKAYDTCWRHLIMEELHRFGMRGKLPLIIADFLNDRKFKVRIGTHYSSVFTQEMGVPQGSVLSVTLFLIAINTVLRAITGQPRISLYVDDMRLSVEGTKLSSITRRMQMILKQLDNWTERTGFRFSSDKTEVVVFHRTRGLFEDPTPELKLKGEKLRVVKEKKFLGMIFDQKLTWISHIKWLKARGIKALNILKILVKNNSRIDSKVLLNIYRAVIRSKLDYGCPVYGTASPSALKMLDTVHHKALRICLCAFRTSPIDSLYIEAGEPSLENRRRSLQLQYFVRSRQLHASQTLVHLTDESHDHHYQSIKNKPKSLGYKVRNEVVTMGLEIPPISTITESQLGPWEQPDIKVCMELGAFVKAVTNREEFVQNFRAHRHDVDIEVYTDGSKTSNGVGSGFGVMRHIPGGIFVGKVLHPMSSVYTAELYAIKMALLVLKVYSGKSCVIYSDSRSALQAIQKLGTSNKLVQEICEQYVYLLQKNIKVLFCWIPSHIGIEGNESADKAAKSAANNEINISQDAMNLTTLLKNRIKDKWEEAAQGGLVHRTEVSASDIKAHIKSKFKEEWQEAWRNTMVSQKLRKIQPTLKKPQISLCRKDSIKLTRLRIGHTRLTHGYLLHGEDRPICLECTYDEEDPVYLTIEHILMECGNYAMDRLPFFDLTNISIQKLFSDQEHAEKVINFFKSCELYKNI